jgi:hypothetical protein
MHSREVIQKHLSKLNPLKYNQFRWWRNYDVPKPLPKSNFIEKRIDNGDFEPSPYFWMAQSVLWEKHDNDNLNLEPFERAKRGGLLLSKYERLMKDFEIDDKDVTDNLKKIYKERIYKDPRRVVTLNHMVSSIAYKVVKNINMNISTLITSFLYY